MWKDSNSLYKFAVISLGVGMSLIWFSLYMSEMERETGISTSNGEAIGYVEVSRDDVKRRPRQQMLWSYLPARRSVYEKDTIRTGPHGFARISLGESGTLELQADSLAVLETQNERFKVRLANGSLFLKGQVSAQLGDKVVEAEKATVGLTRDTHSGEFKIQAQQGSVHVRSIDDDKSIQVGAGDLLLSNKAGEISIQQFPLLRLSPLDNTVVEAASPGDNQVLFEVSLKEDSSPLEPSRINLFLEISTFENFKEALLREPLSASSMPHKLKIKLAHEGRYYWRIIDAQSFESLTTVGSFVFRQKPFVAWMDAPETETPLVLNDKGLSLSLKWKHNSSLSRFKLSFHLEPGSSSNEALYEEYTSSGELNWQNSQNRLFHLLKSQRPEKLRLGVVGVDRQNQVLTPEISTLLKLSGDAKPALPSAAKIEVLPDNPKIARLSWEHPEQRVSFEIKAGSQSFKSDDHHYELESRTLYEALLDSPPEILLRALSPSGLYSDPSKIQVDRERFALSYLFETAQADLLLPSPDRNFVVEASEQLEFRWAPVEHVYYTPESYRLEITGPQDYKHEFANTEAFISLPRPGLYKWAVTPKWPQLGWGQKSEFRSFRVSEPMLEAPVIRMPASKGASP